MAQSKPQNKPPEASKVPLLLYTLDISPQLFYSKLKTLLFGKSYPNSSSSAYLPPSPSQLQTPSTLTVCLPDSLDLDRCLSIFFWLSACEYPVSRYFAFEPLDKWTPGQVNHQTSKRIPEISLHTCLVKSNAIEEVDRHNM